MPDTGLSTESVVVNKKDMLQGFTGSQPSGGKRLFNSTSTIYIHFPWQLAVTSMERKIGSCEKKCCGKEWVSGTHIDGLVREGLPKKVALELRPTSQKKPGQRAV